MTRNEVEEIKRHFDEFGGGLRQELKQDLADQVGGLRQELKQDWPIRSAACGRSSSRTWPTRSAGSAGVEGRLADQVGGLRQELSSTAEQVGGLRHTLGEEIAEVRRHAGVVAEGLRLQIRAVGDGVALANERIDHLDLRVDTLRARCGAVRGDARRAAPPARD